MCLWPILWLLYAAPLTRATAVVGLWSDVLDAEHLQAGGLERANRGLTPRAGALDEYLDLLETVLDALAAAASAVTWAANGVDLREPLNPAPPADSHAITLPPGSVRETIVLLNEVLMCAWPIGTFLRTRRRPR